MRILKISKRKEKGIALIFTLIILSLLLILALGFAINSMFDQKAAHNSANASFAAFLAQAQLKQVLSLIKNDEANLESSQFYSHDSGSPDVTDTNMLKDMLHERLAVPDLLPETEIDTSKVNWSYIRSQDLEKRIIGRTAFIVIANGIPLNSIISSKYDETLNAELRIGKDVSEINVSPAISSPTSAMINVFNWEKNKPVVGDGFTGGGYTGNWLTYGAIFKAIKAVAVLNAAQEKDIRENLSIVSAKDKEAFWADTNGDSVIDSNELYKRFDLTRNWETANHAEDLTFIKDKILLTSGTAPDIDMESFTEADSDINSRGLPWLACFGYKEDVANPGNWIPDESLKGTFGNVLDRRMQIAANLKDYCDNDGGVNRPTSDVSPLLSDAANWSTTAPAFTGNEKTPYINKLGCNVRVLRSQSGSDVSATISVAPCVELINIYGENWPDDLRVTVVGKIKIKTTIDGTSFGVDDYDIDTTAYVAPVLPYISFRKYVDAATSGDWKLSGYSSLRFGAYKTATLSKSSCTGFNVKVEVTAIEFTKVILHDDTYCYDYTRNLNEILPAASPFPVYSSSTDPEQSAWLGFAVHDPRQNLNSEDWLYLTPSVNAYATAADTPSGTFSIVAGGPPYYGAANSNAPSSTEKPTTGPDLETVSDPANGALSTAFIRNGAMQSPWELGFIHRGKKWETINLKTYDSLKAYKTISIGTAPNVKKYLAGGGLHGAGDANILDQIKMTAKAQSLQKINLRSQKNTTFDALFNKVKLGCGIDSAMSVNSIATGVSPAGIDIDLSAVSYTDMRTAIIAFFKTAGTANRTRASIAGQLVLPAGATTDAAKEELIGKIINLTELNGKVGSFTIIILAQMIKDVGGPVGSPVSISKYSGDTLTSGTQDCEIGVFNADINDINDSKKNIYYDEITAEQKIIVKGYRMIDGNIKITSFQYVD